jgi:hypothetical protein
MYSIQVSSWLWLEYRVHPGLAITGWGHQRELWYSILCWWWHLFVEVRQEERGGRKQALISQQALDGVEQHLRLEQQRALRPAVRRLRRAGVPAQALEP